MGENNRSAVMVGGREFWAAGGDVHRQWRLGHLSPAVDKGDGGVADFDLEGVVGQESPGEDERFSGGDGSEIEHSAIQPGLAGEDIASQIVGVLQPSVADFESEAERRAGVDNAGAEQVFEVQIFAFGRIATLFVIEIKGEQQVIGLRFI